MTPLAKRWHIAPAVPPEHLSRLTDLHPLIVQVLYNRDIKDSDAVLTFLEGGKDGANPFALQGMHEAVSRVRRALRHGERIAVYGDFDADGVTATALLVQTLEALGGRVQPYIPDRVDEGYGLNEEALQDLAQDGVSLVITVDCGVRAVDEIAAANRLGLDVVVTDHHTVDSRLPDAVAVVDPKRSESGPGGEPLQSGDALAGVGVAYRLAQALLRSHRQSPVTGQDVALEEEQLLDLVALGTVADLVPLQGQNRSLVRGGLKRLNDMDRPGIRALCRQVGLRPGAVDATAIGYVLGPRVNAAGRLARAGCAYRLLVTSDPVEAHSLAVELDGLNRERRRMTSDAHQMARQMVQESGGDGLVLFAAAREFSRGIVGLVASRLLDEFYRPAVVVQMGERVSRGSCRSIESFDITGALDECQDLLLRHGGHAAAAGFEIANRDLEALAGRLREIAAARLTGEDLVPVLRADAEAPLSEMSWELLDGLSQLEPCGVGNRQPLFVSRGVRVRHSLAVGREGRHLKLTLSDGAATWDAIAFRQGAWAGRLTPLVDVAYHLELNEWRGQKQLQLNVQDIRPVEDGC